MTPWVRDGGMLVPSNEQSRARYMQRATNIELENQRRIREALTKAGQVGYVPDASKWSATGGHALTEWVGWDKPEPTKAEPTKAEPIQTTGQLSGQTSVAQPVASVSAASTSSSMTSSPQDDVMKRRLGMIEAAEKQAQTDLRERAGSGGGSIYDPSFGAAQQDITEKRQQAMQNAYADIPTQQSPQQTASTNLGSRYSYVGMADPRPTSSPQPMMQSAGEPELPVATRRLYEAGRTPAPAAPTMSYGNTNNIYEAMEQRVLSGQPKPTATMPRPTDQAAHLPRAKEVYNPRGATAQYTPPPPAPAPVQMNTASGGPAGIRYGVPSAADQRTAPVVRGFGSTGTGYYDGSGIQLGVPGQGGWSGGKSGASGASLMGIQPTGVSDAYMRQVQQRRAENEANAMIARMQSPDFIREFQQAGGGMSAYQQALDNARQAAFITKWSGR